MKHYWARWNIGIVALLSVMLLSLAISVSFSQQRVYAASVMSINGETCAGYIEDLF